MGVIRLPDFAIVPKPVYNRPCNGCGLCCEPEVCKIGQEAFEISAEQTPCPAMMFIDNKVRCGFVEAEKLMDGEPLITKALGIGKGCCSNFNKGERYGRTKQTAPRPISREIPAEGIKATA